MSVRTPPLAAGVLPPLEAACLGFVAEMRGVQLPQLARWLGLHSIPAIDPAAHNDTATCEYGPAEQAASMVARWRAAWLVESAALGLPGSEWVWATQDGLTACGLPYRGVPPSLSRLRHTHAVTEVRLSMERLPGYRQGGAWWRSERAMMCRNGYWKRDQHVPDAEVHWPPDGDVPWAGERWAIEVELTRKSRARIAAIIDDVLARTGDYGCPAAEVAMPGLAPRYARVMYACSPAVVPVVTRVRGGLGDLAARVELYQLTAAALVPGLTTLLPAPPGDGDEAPTGAPARRPHE